MNGRTFLALGGALLLLTPFARAQDASAPETRKAATKAAPRPGGLVVFVDPTTGKVRQPDPAEIAALLALRAGSAATTGVEPPLEMILGPGGAVGIVLDSRYETFMVATKTPDGKLATSCVTGGRNASQAVAGGARAAAAPEGKEARHAP